MRILQISSAKTFGGGERHVVDLCRGLQSRDHDVFAALRPTSQWQDRLNFLPPERLLRVSIRNSIGVFSAIKMAEFAREHDIDVIHAHVARDYIPASIACMAARDARFVLTRHVMFPLKPFNRFALKNLSMAIGVSEAVGGELRRIFPYDKVRVIPNGLDTQSVDAEDGARLRSEFRSSHSLPMDAPIVGTLGELKELKGQREFVLAAAEIVKKIPNCRFVVVGLDNTVDKRFRRDLKRLALVSGIESQILWLDWLEDTAPFYAAIDVFVSPSRSESFGLAILEAMGNGKPIVSTATDGAQQLLKDCGTLVGVNDAVGMADAIVGVLKNPDLLNASGPAAKKVAAQRYSLDRMIAATEKLYSELLSDRPASSLK
jgi:glycosyltransferase involved in cell wall biosynthesis